MKGTRPGHHIVFPSIKVMKDVPQSWIETFISISNRQIDRGTDRRSGMQTGGQINWNQKLEGKVKGVRQQSQRKGH